MEIQNTLYPVEKIVDKRVRKGKVEYRVRWRNYSPETDSWEPSKSLKDTCYILIKNYNERLRNSNRRNSLSSTSNVCVDFSEKSNGIIATTANSSLIQSKICADNATKDNAELANENKSKTSNKMILYLEDNEIEEPPLHKSHGLKIKTISPTSNSTNYSDQNAKTSSPRISFHSMSTEKTINLVEESSKCNDLKRKMPINQIETIKKIKISDKDSKPTIATNDNYPMDSVSHSLNKIDSNIVKQMGISACDNMNMSHHIVLEAPVLSNEISAAEIKLDKCLKRLPYQRHKDLENVESVEGLVMRRRSARQMGGSNRFREIIVRKDITAGFTEISLYNSSHSQPNCFTVKILNELSAALKQAINDSSRVLLLTAVGKVFSSGLDLESIVRNHSTSYGNLKNSRFSTAQLANPLSHFQYLQDLAESLKRFLLQLLNFPKPIIVGVNGPAIGLGCAILPLCDLIYATESSSFHLPYAYLSQFPEGGTSVTLSMLIGMPAANQLLLGGRRWSAKEALNRGLISEIIFSEKFKAELFCRCRKLANVPSMSMETMKCMLRFQFKEKIELTINLECKKLLDIWRTSEFQNSAEHFIDKQLPDLLV